MATPIAGQPFTVAYPATAGETLSAAPIGTPPGSFAATFVETPANSGIFLATFTFGGAGHYLASITGSVSGDLAVLVADVIAAGTTPPLVVGAPLVGAPFVQAYSGAANETVTIAGIGTLPGAFAANAVETPSGSGHFVATYAFGGVGPYPVSLTGSASGLLDVETFYVTGVAMPSAPPAINRASPGNVTRGDDYAIPWSLVDAAGNPYPLQSCTLWFAAMPNSPANATDDNALFVQAIAFDGNGAVTKSEQYSNLGVVDNTVTNPLAVGAGGAVAGAIVQRYPHATTDQQTPGPIVWEVQLKAADGTIHTLAGGSETVVADRIRQITVP